MRKKPAAKTTKSATEKYSSTHEEAYDEEAYDEEDYEYYDSYNDYNCKCYDCMKDKAAEKKKSAAKKKTTKKPIVGRVARARNFVDTILAELDDWIGQEKYSECKIVNNIMDFSNPRRYFVHLQHERRGCFGGEGKFMNKSEIMKMLQNQLEPDDYRDVEDRIVIFDTQINKVVKPRIILCLR